MSEEVGLRNDTKSLVQLKTGRLICKGEVILEEEVLPEGSEIEDLVGRKGTEWLLTQHAVIVEILEEEMTEVVDSRQEAEEAALIVVLLAAEVNSEVTVEEISGVAAVLVVVEVAIAEGAEAVVVLPEDRGDEFLINNNH